MLTITKPAPDRLDLSLEGQIDKDAMNEGLSALIEGSEGIENGKMLYTITGLTMPTPAALAVEFSYLPKLFSLIGRFRRCAVLSDIAWIRTAAEFEGVLLPGLTIKAFELNQGDAAEAWLNGEDYEGGAHSLPI